MSAGFRGRTISFEQTVPRWLVHRAAISEVFITDVCATGVDAFTIGAQWPRAHSFYPPVASRWYDPMLLVETIRQAGLAIAHEIYRISPEDHILWHSMSFDVSPDELEVSGRPTNIVVEVVSENVRHRGKAVAGMDMTFSCHSEGRQVGTSQAHWSCLSPRAYERLRGPRPAPRPRSPIAPAIVSPSLVGRQTRSDVVLGEQVGEHAWALRVDTGHPTMFDHPVDHVPGMVAIEAARQSALLAAGSADALPVTGAVTFAQYIDLDEPCTVWAEPSAGNIIVTLRQGNADKVTVTLTLRHHTGRGQAEVVSAFPGITEPGARPAI